MSDWKKTQVWQRLTKIKNDEGERVRSFLLNNFCMDRIEKILNTGGTSPKDFTLHDADHSYRVVERMWELIPVSTLRWPNFHGQRIPINLQKLWKQKLSDQGNVSTMLISKKK